MTKVPHMLAIALGALALVPRVAAQVVTRLDCGARLRAASESLGRQVEGSGHSERILGKVEELVSRLVISRWDTSQRATVDPDTISWRIRESPEDVSAALARMFLADQGPYSSEHARIAAMIYSNWGLPALAARRVLLDTRNSAYARHQALVAVSGRASEPWFHEDAMLIGCDLAGASRGRQVVWGLSDSLAVDSYLLRVLDYHERDLLITLAQLLVVQPSASRFPSKLASVVGDQNPVSSFLAAYWASRGANPR